MTKTLFITGASSGIGAATAKAAAAAGWNVGLFARSEDKLNALVDEIGDQAMAQGGTEKGDPEDWKSMVDLNVMGALYTAHAAMPHLRKTTGQYMVTGSAAGRRHIKGSIYGATKFFIHGFAGNLADEMAEWGGRCMVVSPGMVNTAFFDEAKPDKLQPDDVASAVMHALEAPAHVAVREIHLMPVG